MVGLSDRACPCCIICPSSAGLHARAGSEPPHHRPQRLPRVGASPPPLLSSRPCPHSPVPPALPLLLQTELPQTEAARKPHLPTCETRPPPPGPEGSPIRRQSPSKAKQAGGLGGASVVSRASSVRSMRSAAASAAHAESSAPEPVVVVMEVHVLAEVVRESSDYLYQVEDTATLFASRPPKHIPPEHPLLVPEGLGGLRRESRSEKEKAGGYVDEDYLDEEGGILVGEVMQRLFQQLLASTDVQRTMTQQLRPEERSAFFAELKPERPPYELLADALGVGRRDHYLVDPEVRRHTTPHRPCSWAAIGLNRVLVVVVLLLYAGGGVEADRHGHPDQVQVAARRAQGAATCQGRTRARLGGAHRHPPPGVPPAAEHAPRHRLVAGHEGLGREAGQAPPLDTAAAPAAAARRRIGCGPRHGEQLRRQQRVLRQLQQLWGRWGRRDDEQDAHRHDGIAEARRLPARTLQRRHLRRRQGGSVPALPQACAAVSWGGQPRTHSPLCGVACVVCRRAGTAR